MLGEILHRVLDILVNVSALVWSLVILAIPVLWVFVTVMERREARRSAKLLQAVEEIKLSDGVTLLRAVQAYFGPDAHWIVLGDLVCIYGGLLRPRIQVRTVPVSGGLDRLEWRAWAAHGELTGEEINDLLSSMAEAAKNKRTNPES